MIVCIAPLLAAVLSDNSAPICRCRAQSPCFDNIPFNELNMSVNGRLVEVPDEFDACLSTTATPSCQAQLNRTDEQFFYTDQVGGFLHTGLAAGGGKPSWDIAHNLSAYAVAAETPEDVAAGVAFAAKHNLRLAIKGTGHDWFGRSGSHPSFEGSLLIWTHKMKNIRWENDGFVPVDCDASDAVDNAVSLQAGIQFSDIYPVAEQRGRFVNGGGCTSVGVGGCTLGGCFGTFSQKFGASANNVIQAKVCTYLPFTFYPIV